MKNVFLLSIFSVIIVFFCSCDLQSDPDELPKKSSSSKTTQKSSSSAGSISSSGADSGADSEINMLYKTNINALDIVITEINWSGVSGTESCSDGEFIELYNTRDYPVNMGKSSIIYTNDDGSTVKEYCFPVNIIIYPKNFLVIFVKNNNYIRYYSTNGYSSILATNITSIANDGFSLSLLDESNNIIDYLNARGLDEGGFDLAGSASSVNKKSMERKFPFIPGNNSQAWATASAYFNVFDGYSKTFTTPGTSNSIWLSQFGTISNNVSEISNINQCNLLLSNSFEPSDGFTNLGDTNWLQMANEGKWKGNGTSIYSSGKRTGTLGAGIKNADAFIQTPQMKNPGILEFWCKTSGASSANFTIEIQSSQNSIDWTTYTNLSIAGASGTGGINSSNFTKISTGLNLNGSYYIRWHRVNSGYSTGVFYMDDITLSTLSV